MQATSQTHAAHLFINGWQAGMGAVGQGVYASRLLQGFARHLNPAQFDTTLLTASTRPLAFLPLRTKSLSFKPFRHPTLNAFAWNHRFLSEPQVRDRDAVVFSPGPIWGVRAPERLAVTYHDCIYRHFPVYLGRSGVRKITTRLVERYLRRAQIVFTESDHARDDIANWSGIAPERIHVIPAWLPPEFDPQKARQNLSEVRTRYALPERYWLYIGGYDVRKNVEFLIRAYAKARESAPCPPLVLAGRIPSRQAPTLCDVASARRETRLDSTSLREPGFIADADLPALYAGAELLIFPSLMEGYGLSPLEAMGCGCPAIVADNSSLREVVSDANYRFDTKTLDALIALLLAAAKTPLPLNPSFRRENHDEARAIHRYLDALARMGTA